jgi:hypothetical protein
LADINVGYRPYTELQFVWKHKPELNDAMSSLVPPEFQPTYWEMVAGPANYARLGQEDGLRWWMAAHQSPDDRMRLEISPGVYLSRDELTELEERLTTPSVAQHMAARAVVVGAGVDPFDGDPALNRRLQAAMHSRQHWTTAHRTKL